jgi:hypothetical protein
MRKTPFRKHLKTMPTASLTALATAVTALAVVIPSAFAATSITPANGQEFVLPTGNLYQLGPDAAFHLVPDLPTATEMGVLWAQVKHVNTISPIGRPLPSVLTLPTTKVTTAPPTVMANGKDYVLPGGSIYQLDANGVYHLIPDVLTANAMRVDWGKLIHAKSLQPIGAPLASVVVKVQRVCRTMAPTAVTRANGLDFILPNGNVYQFSNGTFHLIPDVATATAMGLQWGGLHQAKTISPAGEPIPSVCTS